MASSLVKYLRKMARLQILKTPESLKKNWVIIDDSGLKKIKQSLSKNYHIGPRSEDRYKPESFQFDLISHLYSRLEIDRTHIIPWLNHHKPLKNSLVLEVGCGTGSSTVALAEQGAQVTGIDLDEGAMTVLKDRLDVFGLQAKTLIMNAADLHFSKFKQNFDFIIFFASLEHMLID